MTDRKNQFNEFVSFNFSELEKILFESQPRNATDYYYHSKTKTVYSYYFGCNPGRWTANVEVDGHNIKSPSALSKIIPKIEAKNEKLRPVSSEKMKPLLKSTSSTEKIKPLVTSTEKITSTSDELKMLELKFKLSENYKLELEVELLKLEIQKSEVERKLVEAQIKLKTMKQKSA